MALGRPLSGEVEHALDDPCDSIGLRADHAGHAPQVLRQARIPSDQLGEGGDGGKRVVELMCDARRELFERRGLRGAFEDGRTFGGGCMVRRGRVRCVSSVAVCPRSRILGFGRIHPAILAAPIPAPDEPDRATPPSIVRPWRTRPELAPDARGAAAPGHRARVRRT